MSARCSSVAAVFIRDTQPRISLALRPALRHQPASARSEVGEPRALVVSVTPLAVRSSPLRTLSFGLLGLVGSVRPAAPGAPALGVTDVGAVSGGSVEPGVAMPGDVGAAGLGAVAPGACAKAPLQSVVAAT